MTRIAMCLCLVIALAADGVAQKSPAKQPVKNPAKSPAKKPVKNSGKSPAKKPVKKPVKNPGKKPVKSVVKKPVKVLGKSPGKRPSKQRTQLNTVAIKQAFAFAQAHHPELAKLLGRLQSAGNRAAFQKAITELSRTARRLKPIKKTNPERYEMMVELWKLESQARLMVARSAMESDPDPERDVRLRETLRKRSELRRTMLLSDIKRSQARIERIETQLKSLEDLDAATDRELRRLKRTARITAARTKGRGGKRPGKVVPVKAGKRPLRPGAKPGASKQPNKTKIKIKGKS